MLLSALLKRWVVGERYTLYALAKGGRRRLDHGKYETLRHGTGIRLIQGSKRDDLSSVCCCERFFLYERENR